MARTQISTLANGVLLSRVPTAVASTPLLSPLSGVAYAVVVHGSTTPIAVYAAETGSSPQSPMTTDENGAVQGWIEQTAMSSGADLVVTLPAGGTQTFALVPVGGFGGGSGGGSSAQTFTQSSPATTWTIAHGLGRHPVGLMVCDSTGQQRLPSVTNPDGNTTVIQFLTAQSGTVVYE